MNFNPAQQPEQSFGAATATNAMFGTYQPTVNEMSKPWADGERVVLVIKQFEVNEMRALFDTVVASGEHAGKPFNWYLPLQDKNDAQRRLRQSWLKAMFPEEKLLKGEYDPAEVVGKSFSFEVSYYTTKDDKTYTNYNNLRGEQAGQFQNVTPLDTTQGQPHPGA
jgi:hypothetical protein